ncbi:multisubunit sodium/proton antiporter, MrpB subunit [Marinobacter sp. DSM 26671]|jgi:multicomponent Na+:H+ antiporter subunit B|uniref:Na+/H+ antiporter subunit B n=3 Tax=Marinobacter TaxID=2742 RepID=A0A3D8H724_9GAMM|nr:MULTISPECIES: Na+/H+ antiporter subunit B [Marinobacter]MCW9007840.1 Na+/H+ antiporter subunit B [Marinobacter sp.]MBW4977135.1 Na+/H+ antiporter subunit B [Marinobacter adhaerens]PPI81760.1 Na(+)/H(+) antiporter subunit B [Marinobacter flavimaris]QWV12358.1 Na+/H+ antiporter subunit B [Marinobacter adhaerens]RDU42211.1 Na+/H+ antiporter subunit B [Marinobacter flavimaris]|tara:strand:+ start:8193 stop:8618 length:426 start_codon:yes stop_codon:yes gene_type:complete
MKTNTLILHTAALAIMPLQLMFSVFLLLRGHDEPGGGFIGGLVAASAFVLYAFAFGAESTRKLLRVSPRDILAAGLLFGLASTIPAFWTGQAMLTALWWEVPLPGEGYLKLSTVLIFDIGVYLAVLGTLMTFVISLMESDE